MAVTKIVPGIICACCFHVVFFVIPAQLHLTAAATTEGATGATRAAAAGAEAAEETAEAAAAAVAATAAAAATVPAAGPEHSRSSRVGGSQKVRRMWPCHEKNVALSS